MSLGMDPSRINTPGYVRCMVYLNKASYSDLETFSRWLWGPLDYYDDLGYLKEERRVRKLVGVRDGRLNLTSNECESLVRQIERYRGALTEDY